MKAAEILRKLADVIEQNSQGAEEQSAPQVSLEPVAVDNTDNTEASTQIPPLQAKLELLKKSMGMDNAYDSAQGCGCEEPCDCASQTDSELALIKQRAGVPVTVVHELGDDDGAFEG